VLLPTHEAVTHLVQPFGGLFVIDLDLEVFAVSLPGGELDAVGLLFLALVLVYVISVGVIVGIGVFIFLVFISRFVLDSLLLARFLLFVFLAAFVLLFPIAVVLLVAVASSSVAAIMEPFFSKVARA